jgi:integration host factor subunit alpha
MRGAGGGHLKKRSEDHVTKVDIAMRIREKLLRYNDFSKITTRGAQDLLELVLQVMKDTLDSGEDLKISGFGCFHVKLKNPRRGRNPQTGESITLDSRRIVTFKPSTLLRKAVNGESKG